MNAAVRAPGTRPAMPPRAISAVAAVGAVIATATRVGGTRLVDNIVPGLAV